MQIHKTRPNAKQRIINAAFEHFVTHGYDGASLNDIAITVGIRKASIYAHFSSKESIFIELLEKACQEECEYLEACFIAAIEEEIPGEAYCYTFKMRYTNSITLRFLARMAYAPPTQFMELITEKYLIYIQLLTKHINISLKKIISDETLLEIYSDAYLGIVDSLSVELLYGGDLYDRRFKAMFFLYRNTLQQSIKLNTY